MIENPNVICNECGFCKQNKELEDKCERLQKQLEVAENAIEYARRRCENCINGICQYCHLSYVVTYYKDKEKALKELERK